jgi:hypothetical protein
MIRRIPLIIPIYMPISTARRGVETAFALLEAGGWGFGCVFLGGVSFWVASVAIWKGGDGWEMGREGIEEREKGGKWKKYPIHHCSISYHLC